jgi:Kef-type K+ transport system membrane component KefB
MGAALLAGLHVLPPVAVITEPQLRSVVLVLLASTLGALLSRLHGRVVLPTVVLEIALGILIGPHVLGLATVNAYVGVLSNFGLAFLFFVAGVEVVEMRVAHRLLRLGTVGWMVSLTLALAVGWLLQQAGLDAEWWLLGVALCTTALGALVPILSDAGVLGTPFGSAVIGSGIAGEFWPIVVISVFLTGAYGAWREVLLLIAFGGLVFLTSAVVLSARPSAVVRVLQETVHTSGQAAVRGSIFLLSALVLLSADAGFDFVLGAFAAGLIVGLALDSPEGQDVRLRLEGIGFGLLIPIYFVATGMAFDLGSLLSPGGLALAALFLVAFLVIGGTSALFWARALDVRKLAGLTLCSATGLPLIAAIVGIGSEHGGISNSVGASLIGAGMISVLVYPLLAILLVGRTRETAAHSRRMPAEIPG